MRFKAHWASIVIASIAFGFSDAAIARPVTFAWDASPDWPSGTTVELEANGTSANGITANQHTIDVPVQPGEVINARARAIPPSGYECGEPLAPCPPSPWSEQLVQTVPQNPSGLWATKELAGGSIVAASVYGSNKNYSTANVNTLNVSLTVGGSNKVLYVFVGSGAGSPVAPSSVKWRGSSGTALTQLSSTLTVTAYGRFSVWRLINPASATDNVTVSWGSNQDETLVVAVACQDADQTTPEGTIASNITTTPTPNATATTVSGDLVLGATFFLITSPDNYTITTTQTSIQEIEGSNTSYEGLAASYTTATGTTQNMGYTISGTPAGNGIFAFAVKGASGATTNTSTTGLNALVQKTGITATSSLSALLQKSFSGTVSLDALSSALKSGNVSIDALLQATDNSATVSVDGLLQAVKTGAVSIDAAVAIIVAATSGIDALLQSSFSATAGLDAIVSGSSTVTASLDGLIQSGKSTTSFIDALLQVGYLSQTDIDAIISKAFSSTVLLDALLQAGASTSTSLDAIISGGISASVVLDALLQAGAVSTASIDALLQKTGSSTVSLDTFIQGSASAVASLDALIQATKTGTLSLDAIIVSAGQALATTSLDGLLQAVKSGTISLDAMVAVPVAGATVGLDALLSMTRVSTVSIGALLQATKTGMISIDGLVQSAETAQVSIDGLVQAAKSGTVSLDSIVGIIGSAAISLDGILQKSMASGVFIDAIIGLISSIIMPTGRVISIASSDRYVVISETDRFIVIPNSDRSVIK